MPGTNAYLASLSATMNKKFDKIGTETATVMATATATNFILVRNSLNENPGPSKLKSALNSGLKQRKVNEVNCLGPML